MNETNLFRQALPAPAPAAAVLLLCRLFLFFCSETPYTAAYAAGTAAAVFAEGVFLFVLLRRKHSTPKPFSPRILHIFAALWGFRLTAAFFSLSHSLHLTHTPALIFLLIPVLFCAVSKPVRAAARTATVLLTAGCLGFLLLPVSGIRTAHPVALFTPDSFPAAFLTEILRSGDLLLLPLLVRDRVSARRTLLIRTAGCGIFLPLLILFGTMQNVRLTALSANPFFLLLARTPLSDAFRADGFWMLYAFCCGAFCIAACLRLAVPPMHPKEQL